MRIVRFLTDGRISLGEMIDARSAKRIDGDLFGDWRVTDEVLKIDKILAPIVPVDILCIGINYREHAAESGSSIPTNPVLFIKAGNTLNNPGDAIPIPRRSSMIDYEGELAVVIGRAAKHVPRERALEHVFGYCIANDVSARDWQRQKELGGGQFARGKSFDGFCPLGPWITTKDEVPSPNALRLRTILNDEVMQDHTTADMIFVALAELYRATGDDAAKRKALSGINALTYMQSDAGLFRTFFQLVNENKPGKVRPNWYSQHLYTVCHVLEAMEAIPELRQ